MRFAPSPTGYVHVGNARTALFNWLFARHYGGDLILRIEDTDVERSEARYETQLMADLRWFGLDWDEGPDRGGPFAPYRQSERRPLYRRRALELMDRGQAYFCFCTPAELEAEREEALKAGRQPKYSGRCRMRPREEAARKVAEGQAASVRLGIPEGEFGWEDLVHGDTRFASDVIGDFILLRSDGNPAYNFAVVVDDHAMEISHVIRGDDHISNTPRQLAVFQAFGWKPPRFAHLSTILGPDRARLSKRHGATSLESFREMGIRPDALRNYLLLLGWSAADGKTEILSPDAMVAQFSLDRVNKSPAVFDSFKLQWLNRQYVAAAPLEEQLEYYRSLLLPFLENQGFLTKEEFEKHIDAVNDVISKVIVNRTERVHVQDAFRLIMDYDANRILERAETREVLNDPDARQVLRAFISKVLSFSTLSYEQFREAAKIAQKETGKRGKELFHPIRVAVTGEVSGLELERLIPLIEEWSKFQLAHPAKSVAQRLRELAEVARLQGSGVSETPQ